MFEAIVLILNKNARMLFKLDAPGRVYLVLEGTPYSFKESRVLKMQMSTPMTANLNKHAVCVFFFKQHKLLLFSSSSI